MKKRAFLYSLCATAMAISGLVLGAAPASASINNTPGYFHIQNVRSGKCIDATYPNNDPSAGYAQQWRCLNTAFEEWKYVPWTDPFGNRTGLFQIVNGYTGQCLTQFPTVTTSGGVTTSSFQNGSPVVVRPCYGAADYFYQQAWSFGEGGGQNQLVSQTYGLRCLDLSDGDTSDGVPMQVWDCNANTNNQRWQRL